MGPVAVDPAVDDHANRHQQTHSHPAEHNFSERVGVHYASLEDNDRHNPVMDKPRPACITEDDDGRNHRGHYTKKRGWP